MFDEFVILEKLLEQMAGIVNLQEGEQFHLRDMETLHIVLRRIKESHLKTELESYSSIFEKASGVSLIDIVKSASSYVKIKTLVENKVYDFDGITYRLLIKEYQNQIVKVKNIMHLSKVNVMSVESYQKESIEKTLAKYEAFLKAFQNEITVIESKIARMPVVEEIDTPIQTKEKKVNSDKDKVSTPIKKAGLLTKLEKAYQTRQEKKDIDSRLKEEQKNTSETYCVEIPFYDKSLNFTEMYRLKDIEEYVLLKRKNDIYFGLKANVKRMTYNNADNSLLELTEATEDFIQFATVDLLNGVYELKSFTKREKEAMRMYFNFLSWCFEKFIGVTVTVKEYLDFKNYYNRLIIQMQELEEKQRNNYYRALALANLYETYMDSYDMDYSNDTELITKNITDDRGLNYLNDLEIIIVHHIVDETAKKEIKDLMDGIRAFCGEPLEELEQTDEENPKNEDAVIISDSQTELITAGIKLQISCLNKDMEIVDEAVYVASNMEKAVADYLSRNAYVKRMYLCIDKLKVCLYEFKHGILIPMSDKSTEKLISKGTKEQAELVRSLDMHIREMIIKLTDLEEEKDEK